MRSDLLVANAFEMVTTTWFYEKMFKYGVRGTPLRWFSSYLTGWQFVKIGDVESSPKLITCGVPQGSTLGPLRFLLYINDLPKSSNKLSFRIFADNTNIFFSSKNIQKSTKANAQQQQTNVRQTLVTASYGQHRSEWVNQNWKPHLKSGMAKRTDKKI